MVRALPLYLMAEGSNQTLLKNIYRIFIVFSIANAQLFTLTCTIFGLICDMCLLLSSLNFFYLYL